ncbi:hypothetical protein ACJJWD_13635 [Comamonas testosteroni]|uniref:hypothetical protein n=1 Tax=Comamonas testosteroni TaxID=285 RepID=UPI00389A65FB
MTQKKPLGRSLSDFGSLKPAEEKLLKACRLGITAVCGDAVPESPTDENCVRAGFLRFLLLGGDEQSPVHERGVMLQGAYVDGALDLNSCLVPRGISLHKCNFSKAINAQDTTVEGILSLTGSYLAALLSADSLKCASDIFLNSKFKANAGVTLTGAQIGGSFICDGGYFNAQINKDFNAAGGSEFEAIAADGANVAGDVALGRGFQAYGDVRLPGAQIGGDLNCAGGLFDGKNGDAFYVGRAQIKGSVFLCDGFNARGRVIFAESQIGNELRFDGGRFEVDKGVALVLNGADVAGDVSFCLESINDSLTEAKDRKLAPFHAIGRVSLVGMEIGGELNCDQGQFQLAPNQDGTETRGSDCTLDMSFTAVRRAWRFKCKDVRVNASHAQVGVLKDNLAAWARCSTLDGFRYGSFGSDASTNGEERIEWLHRQNAQDLGAEKFCPQPWRQLQRVLREMGHTEDAKLVGIAFEEHIRKIGHVGQSVKSKNCIAACWRRITTRSAHCIFGLLAGYGYRPMRLVTWMLAVWLACAAAYWFLALPPHSAIAPSDPLVFQSKQYQECQPDHFDEPGNWYLCEQLRSEYATFSPLAYSLDLMLPVVDLGLEKNWGAYIPSPKQSWFEELFMHWHSGHVVRLITWFEVLFGWVSSLLLVAIISGFSRRNDEE